MGAVVLISAAHAEVRRRGSGDAQQLGEGFAAVVLRAADAMGRADPQAAVHACFGTVFATSVIRVAYGGGFTTASPTDDDTFVADVGEQAVRYLLR